MLMEEKKNSMTILINGENTVIKFTVYNIFSKRGREWNFSISKTVSTRNTQQALSLVVK